MSPTKIAISPEEVAEALTEAEVTPEEVDILIEALRSWGPETLPSAINAKDLRNWRVEDKALWYATEAYALRDRLVAERSERRAHAEALADSDCPDDIVLCNVCGYDIDGDDPAFACHCSSDDDCPDDIALGVGSEHPER